MRKGRTDRPIEIDRAHPLAIGYYARKMERLVNPPSTQLRVALFLGNYNCVRDGANQALNRLVDYLERHAGAEVRVYSPTVKHPAFIPAGNLVSIPSIPIPGRSEYRLASNLPNRIKQDITEFCPNIVHLSAPDYLGWSAMKFARTLGVPVVSSLHTRFEAYVEHYGLRWLREPIGRYLAKFYSRSDLVLAPTPTIVEELRRKGLGDRVMLWSRGVDQSAFNQDFRSVEWRRSLGIGDDDVALLFFGRLVREKGLNTFAEIVSQLREQNVNIVPLFVGDGPGRAWVEENVTGAVLTGHLSGPSLGRAVASADIFVNPSVTEAFGNVTLEAMASGIGIVCANVASARSLITDGKTGILCNPESTTAYVDSVRYLAQNTDARLRLGRNAAAASHGYSWPETLAAVVLAYSRALATLILRRSRQIV